jgi:hypothetical protein
MNEKKGMKKKKERKKKTKTKEQQETNIPLTVQMEAKTSFSGFCNSVFEMMFFFMAFLASKYTVNFSSESSEL